jgi:hypothetical protein
LSRKRGARDAAQFRLAEIELDGIDVGEQQKHASRTLARSSSMTTAMPRKLASARSTTGMPPPPGADEHDPGFNLDSFAIHAGICAPLLLSAQICKSIFM